MSDVADAPAPAGMDPAPFDMNGFSLAEAALAYVTTLDWPVFPCHAISKRPLLKSETAGEGGFKLASRDLDQVAAWWKKWPKAMIGVPTGPPMGCFVIDLDAGIDDKTGEVFEVEALYKALESELGEKLPPTWTVETPRGGWHLYYLELEGDPIRNRTNLIKRVDVRGDGGYVIVPPSRRADGKVYRWLHGPTFAKVQR